MSTLFAARCKTSQSRSTRRQYLVLHLHRAGPRIVLEAMLELEAGHDLDTVLEAFGKIPIDVYRAVGADRLPAYDLIVVEEGRR